MSSQLLTQTFISRCDVQSENSVLGKSFMPSLLDALPDQNVIDLATYIQTLK